MIYKLPDLREHPQLLMRMPHYPRSRFQISPTIKYDHDRHRSQMFHGAALASWRRLFSTLGLNGLVSSFKN